KNLKYFFYRCKNAVFVVVSDDKQYCEKYLSAPDVIIAGTSGNINDPQIDYHSSLLFSITTSEDWELLAKQVPFLEKDQLWLVIGRSVSKIVE
ncbi:hypothetical protein Avbf_18579, partial [Armadillidium vulgare]